MIIISQDTLFYGEPIYNYKRILAKNINSSFPKSKIKTLFFTDKCESFNFITQLENDKECAGTAICEKGKAICIMIAGYADTGTFKMPI